MSSILDPKDYKIGSVMRRAPDIQPPQAEVPEVVFGREMNAIARNLSLGTFPDDPVDMAEMSMEALLGSSYQQLLLAARIYINSQIVLPNNTARIDRERFAISHGAQTAYQAMMLSVRRFLRVTLIAYLVHKSFVNIPALLEEGAPADIENDLEEKIDAAIDRLTGMLGADIFS